MIPLLEIAGLHIQRRQIYLCWKAKELQPPLPPTQFSLLPSSFSYYQSQTAYLTGSEYDPVVVLWPIFFYFLWFFSSYAHSYWTEVLICSKIVPVFLHIKKQKKTDQTPSYFSHFNCIFMLICYTGNELPIALESVTSVILRFHSHHSVLWRAPCIQESWNSTLYFHKQD